MDKRTFSVGTAAAFLTVPLFLLPAETIPRFGEWLRELSLSGAAGNIRAWAIVLALSALPALGLLWRPRCQWDWLLPLAAAETFNAQFAAWTLDEEFQELADLAREERAWRQESDIDWGPAFFTEMTSETYQTDRLVSVAGDYYSYTGGAHPNTVLMAWNFDLETGAFFVPEQLAGDGEAFSKAVSEEIVRQIGETAAEYDLTAAEMFWENYEEIAAGWSSYAVSFDETGMTVGFSPYELAAYAAGPQVFHLSYDLLAPHLGDYGRAVLGLE